MAEWADAPVSDAGVERRAGSMPAGRTNQQPSPCRRVAESVDAAASKAAGHGPCRFDAGFADHLYPLPRRAAGLLSWRRSVRLVQGVRLFRRCGRDGCLRL